MTRSNRSKVLVVGSAPVRSQPFRERALNLERIELAAVDEAVLNHARGIVLAEPPGKFRLLKDYFQGPFRMACTLGVRTIVLCRQNRYAIQLAPIWSAAFDADMVEAASRGFSPVDLVNYVSHAAERIARYDPGPPIGAAHIQKSDSKFELDDCTATLLRRAFWDCGGIVVERLTGGKTRTETFRVYADLAGDQGPPQPSPFFVKIGGVAMITDERLHYEGRAEPYISFHLRPAVNGARCVMGFPSAALVCNFVENAQSLRSVLRGGFGSGLIFSLFEDTLRRLRNHTAQTERQSGVLSAFFSERVKANKFHDSPHASDRLARARKLGLKNKPEQIERILLSKAKAIQTRWGTCHGDLHCGNVMVRGHDAIVIDFGSMQAYGPLTADPATLEVSLIFDTDEKDDPTTFGIWKALVDEVFVNQTLLPPMLDDGRNTFSWIRNAVRELRHVTACCDVNHSETLIVLAGCLLRHARLSKSEMDDPKIVDLSEERRSYALVIAEKLCSLLCHDESP